MFGIEDVGLGELINGLLNRLNHQLGDGGPKLSGSQIQRISIARATFKNSSLFLLEEATNTLDSLNEKNNSIAGRIKKDRKKIILITHRMNNPANVAVVYIFENGEVIGEKTKSRFLEIFNSKIVFRNFSNFLYHLT